MISVNSPAAASAVRIKNVVIIGHNQATDMPQPSGVNPEGITVLMSRFDPDWDRFYAMAKDDSA